MNNSDLKETLLLWMFAYLVLYGVPAAAADPATLCAGAKLQAAGKEAYGKLGCYAKAATRETVVDQACLEKADLRFASVYERAESRGGCLTVGDADPIAAVVETAVSSVVNALSPSTGEARNDARRLVAAADPAALCAGAKLQAAGKQAYGKLGCYAKAATRGTVADQLCLERADLKFASAYEKAEGKGGCLTVGDADPIAAVVETAVSSVVKALSPSTGEICNNAVDDDGDSLIDCADPDCATDVTAEACKPGRVVQWPWGVAPSAPPSSVNGTAGTSLAIAAGYGHGCAIRAGTNAVACWGDNYFGEATPPPSVNGTTGMAVAIGAGVRHSCAIQASTRAVVCWGSNDFGQAMPPSSVNGTGGSASAIATGSASGHSCAIQSGTNAVVCWGRNGVGQATPPPSVNGTAGTARAITVGGLHSCAIQSGTNAVVCWGYNYSGEATAPPSVDGTAGTALAIAAGGNYSCAIQAGTRAVVCWGDNAHGKATRPPSMDGTAGTASAIAAGPNHSCATQSGSRAVVCWGYNSSGQATPPPSVDGTGGRAQMIAVAGLSTLAIQAPECSDGLDADADGLVDYSDDPGCESENDPIEKKAALICDDGIDNDGDGRVDYPYDPGCDSPTDGSETSPALVCDDGIDQDGDGLVDHGQDPGCDDPEDGSEQGTLICDNGIDDDGDGGVDYPGDPNCVDPWDPSEIAGPCEDGLDNDDDGLIDFPDDPGCQSLDGQLENPQCQDGIDNNGDGTLDFDGGASANGGVPLGDPDPSCGAAWWDFEFSFGCIGFFC